MSKPNLKKVVKMRNTLKSADFSLSEAFDSMAEKLFGYTSETSPEAHLYCLSGAHQALKDSRKRRNLGQAPAHITGLDPRRFPELSKLPEYNIPYSNGYNMAVDFIAEFMGWTPATAPLFRFSDE